MDIKNIKKIRLDKIERKGCTKLIMRFMLATVKAATSIHLICVLNYLNIARLK
jgi:hypothetical protein